MRKRIFWLLKIYHLKELVLGGIVAVILKFNRFQYRDSMQTSIMIIALKNLWCLIRILDMVRL